MDTANEPAHDDGAKPPAAPQKPDQTLDPAAAREISDADETRG